MKKRKHSLKKWHFSPRGKHSALTVHIVRSCAYLASVSLAKHCQKIVINGINEIIALLGFPGPARKAPTAPRGWEPSAAFILIAHTKGSFPDIEKYTSLGFLPLWWGFHSEMLYQRTVTLRSSMKAKGPGRWWGGWEGEMALK